MKTLGVLIWIVIKLAILATVATGSFIAGRIYPSVDLSRSPITPVHSEPVPTLESIRQLSSLMVTRVAVADVSQTRIDGYSGGITAIIVIHGDYLLGIDLSKAKFVSVDKSEKSIVLLLPSPTVSSPRLDQEKTRLLYLTRQGLWAILPGEAGQEAVVNHAYRHAQAVVASAGNDPHLREEARHHAESTLGSFLAAIGWKVTVRWAD
jgi:hypothetical protein